MQLILLPTPCSGLHVTTKWSMNHELFDQLMKLGWYFFFELALVNIFITAFVLAYIK